MLGRLAGSVIYLAVALAFVQFAAPATAAREPTPLFASDTPIRLNLSGPFGSIRRAAERSMTAHDGSLTLHGAQPETLPIKLSARGVSRRLREVCAFPPLRIELVGQPPAGSLFRGQRRMKLVTHCQNSAGFQQHVLLEYAAYRLFNVLTPLSLRARLATIDYAEPGAAAPFVSRLGFLIEDVDDAARRNGLTELDIGNIPAARLSPAEAARFAVFQYMIGNLDWGTTRGPSGENCCHNARLLASADSSARLIPVPYDFDHSGLVDAPYATPPEQVAVASVRVRRYRGFCAHNAEAQAAAAQMLAARPQLEAVLQSVPQLEARTRARATAYLAGFFEDIATPELVAANLLRTCLEPGR